MDKCSGTDPDRMREQLVNATLEVSRAHLLLTGIVSWAPPPVRTHAQDALATLERVMLTLRDVSVRLDVDLE